MCQLLDISLGEETGFTPFQGHGSHFTGPNDRGYKILKRAHGYLAFRNGHLTQAAVELDLGV